MRAIAAPLARGRALSLLLTALHHKTAVILELFPQKDPSICPCQGQIGLCTRAIAVPSSWFCALSLRQPGIPFVRLVFLNSMLLQQRGHPARHSAVPALEDQRPFLWFGYPQETWIRKMCPTMSHKAALVSEVLEFPRRRSWTHTSLHQGCITTTDVL